MLTSDLCVVFSLLEDRVTRLHGQLQRHQQHLMASSEPDCVDRKVLDDLYEDIHWLILVAGLSQTKKSEINIFLFHVLGLLLTNLRNIKYVISVSKL